MDLDRPVVVSTPRWPARGRRSNLVTDAAAQSFASQRLRLGIAARLTIAFVAVALLVAAANLVLQNSVLVVRTTEIWRDTVAAKAAAINHVAAVDAAANWSHMIEKDALIVALNHFDLDLQTRRDDDSIQAASQLRLSADALGRAVAAYANAMPADRVTARLRAGVLAHLQDGYALATLADERRSVLAEYAAVLDAMHVQAQLSLQHAWKILGRVVARQSLLDLNTRLDELRRAFALLSAGQAAGGISEAAIVSGEQAIGAQLKDAEISFTKSQGAQWYQSMSGDMARLLQLHATLRQTATQIDDQSAPFARASRALIAALPNQATPTPGVEARPAILAAPAITGAADAATAPAVVKVGTNSVTTGGAEARNRQVLMRWISAAVLALLLIICVGTVQSILRPVRRLLSASERLARGERGIRVPPGGIKELDVLTAAFNHMAERLAHAQAEDQAYQQRLELSVAERTQQLRTLAEQDPLTGLPNRRQLFVLLNAAIERARKSERLMGVFFIDIDNFKYINDSMGHAFGDRLLVSLSMRLQAIAATFGFSARLGGDEFILIFEQAENIASITGAAARVVEAFHEPLSVDRRDLVVSISLGVSIFPAHKFSADDLLSAADAALFRAKALGRSQMSVFTPELIASAKTRFSTEQGLRRALERGEFELVFQPEVNAETFETTLVEALLRWQVPHARAIGPQEFLAVAEESGLIIEIGDWVLRSAIETASAWHHGAWPKARVAINVSPRQLFDHGFADRVRQLLQQSRLPPDAIEIELTESVLQTGRSTIETLRSLRDLGVAIALDDFGTGYSSLASLEQLPLSRIKLDRSLIAGIDSSSRSHAITRAIIVMCEGLGLEITAEGIERAEQFELLLEHSSLYLQGHLLSAPVSGAELMEVIGRLTQHCQQLVLLSHSQTLTPASHELPPALAAPAISLGRARSRSRLRSR